jgi:hypothetical protein
LKPTSNASAELDGSVINDVDELSTVITFPASEAVTV